MKKTRIDDAVLRAMQSDLDAAVNDAAVISLDLARVIFTDPRGAKTLARIAGAAHGTYQRRERLGMLVAAEVVIMPARPDSEEDLAAWEQEAAAAITLHNVCMRTGVTIDLIKKIAKDEAGSAMSPTEVAALILGSVDKDEPEFDLDKIIKALASKIDSTSKTADLTHAALISKITKALATVSQS